MRDRRRTLIAGTLLLAAIGWLDRPASPVSANVDLGSAAPVTAQAALDLGILGTVVLGWTARRLN